VTGTYTWTVAYSGDGNNNAASDQGGPTEQTVVSPASPTLTTTPSPTAVTLGATAPPLLTDSATLAGGSNPTGAITFTLFQGSTLVDMETVKVSGNGTYTTPTGFTLPTTGTVTGTYQWDATYSGDANNNAAGDVNNVNEQVTVDPASPILRSTPNPIRVTLGTNPVTLTDTATLAGGYHPGGTITFTLVAPGGATVDTETVTVSGNGSYTTPTGFTLPSSGTATGTYQWDANYSGDSNNNAAGETKNANERVTVRPANPTISTTPSPSTVMLGGRLQDVADLTGGFDPTGSITFSLYAPGVDPTVGPATYMETVTGVNGDGTYQTTVGFVANATGTWHWVATYNGDSNNNSVSSGPLDEPVTIPQQADLVLTKQVNPAQVIFGFPVVYTLFVHNNGPDPATGVVVSDPRLAGLQFVSATPSMGSYNPATGTWVVGTLANGASANLSVTDLVFALGPITNTAQVAAATFDPDLSNNRSMATVLGMRSAAQVSKQLFLASSSSLGGDPASAELAAFDVFMQDLFVLYMNTLNFFEQEWAALLANVSQLLA
jgi:uncharacterized repeat protein (TIGR01451 family)